MVATTIVVMEKMSREVVGGKKQEKAKAEMEQGMGTRKPDVGLGTCQDAYSSEGPQQMRWTASGDER